MLNQFDLSNTVDELNREVTSMQASVADLDTAHPVGIKTYVGAITQSGTSTPSLTAVLNTTGATISASYMGVGIYMIKSSTSHFSASKTVPLIGGLPGSHAAVKISASVASRCIIKTASGVNPGKFASLANGLLTKIPFEIKVYP